MPPQGSTAVLFHRRSSRMFARLSQITRHLTCPAMPTPTCADPFKRPLRTAACLVIGTEILNGKTVDTNSAYFAKYCFSLGIELKRIEVVDDDEGDIVEAARRMSANYDFVVTSGGIGPTHDDITYSSLAKAFETPLQLHAETRERMKKLSAKRPGMGNFDWETPSSALTARMRMVTLPMGAGTRVLYVNDDMWVPVCVVNYNVHILPGIPRIFVQLLDGLHPIFEAEGRVEERRRSVRVLISTPMMESEVAEYLTDLQAKVGPRGVKVGSYPRWGVMKNTVTLVGADKEYIESLVDEVQRGVNGVRVEAEGEDEEVAVEKAVEKTEEQQGAVEGGIRTLGVTEDI